jgi:hypothetical protein
MVVKPPRNLGGDALLVCSPAAPAAAVPVACFGGNREAKALP